MARPRSDGSKRVPLSARVTEADAELIDRLRGTHSRVVWLEGVIAEALRAARDMSTRAAVARTPVAVDGRALGYSKEQQTRRRPK